MCVSGSSTCPKCIPTRLPPPLSLDGGLIGSNCRFLSPRWRGRAEQSSQLRCARNQRPQQTIGAITAQFNQHSTCRQVKIGAILAETLPGCRYSHWAARCQAARSAEDFRIGRAWFCQRTHARARPFARSALGAPAPRHRAAHVNARSVCTQFSTGFSKKKHSGKNAWAM